MGGERSWAGFFFLALLLLLLLDYSIIQNMLPALLLIGNQLLLITRESV